MRSILRIQNRQGVGMYHAEAGPRPTEHPKWRANDKRHPTPFEDAGLCSEWELISPKDRADYLFGFSSKEQCLSWLYSSRHWEALASCGFFVAEYEVPEWACISGYTQAVFDGTVAKCTRLTPCEDWFLIQQEEAAQALG